MTRRIRPTGLAVTLAVFAALSSPAPAPAQARRQPKRPDRPETRREQAQERLLSDSALAQLKYRYIGPVGNRVSAVAGVAGDPSTYYVGAASGGIWKTTDGGVHWQPIFDDQPVQSIGALAVALSDPNVVWAGTGEAWIRSHISIGNGVYKSTDAGKTWMRMGLEKTGRIARVIVDPSNPQIVLACALGTAYGPQ